MAIWSDGGVETSRKWVGRYLSLLGIEEAPPSLAALTDLIRSHVLTIAFENVTAIRRRAAQSAGPVPPLDANELLTNWEQGRGGGVCFELAPMFARLVQALGYRASLIQGQITFPGSHQGVLVELDGSRYLADVGTAAPFFDPIPLDDPVEIHHLGLSYRFRPGDSPDQWLQDRLIHGSWEPFCRYDLRPSTQEAFTTAYQTHHTPGQSWVVDRLRLIRITPDELISLSDNQLTRFTPTGKHTEPIPDPSSYPSLAATLFNLPNLPILDALTHSPSVAGAPAAD